MKLLSGVTMSFFLSMAGCSLRLSMALLHNTPLRSPSILKNHLSFTRRTTGAGYTYSSTNTYRQVSSSTAEASDAKTTEAAKKQDPEPVELPTNDNDKELLKIRHSTAHVMAMAVQQSFPEAQVTIGPWIDNGFYYDFYFPETKDEETGEVVPSRKLTDQDLKKVKKAMDKIINKKYPIYREEVSREEAKKRIEAINEPFKLEILDSIKTEPITIYHIGDEWWDLCAGPHMESTGDLPKKSHSVGKCCWSVLERR